MMPSAYLLVMADEQKKKLQGTVVCIMSWMREKLLMWLSLLSICQRGMGENWSGR